MSRITLYGFYNWDKSILDGIVVPKSINKELLLDNIIYECGDMYTISQSPAPLKRNIHGWFERNRFNFEKMMEGMTSVYNPIENYDRHEEWTDKVDGEVASQSKTTTDNSSNSLNELERTGSDNNENLVSAFDSSTYSEKDKSVQTFGSKDTSKNITTSGSKAEVSNNDKSETITVHSGRLHGNIGVTTNQSMISDEIELRKNDVYDIITSLFKDKFIIGIY